MHYLLLFLILLVACDNSGTPEKKYSIDRIFPTTVQVGSTLYVSGTLPASAIVTIDGISIATQPISGGVQLVIPEGMVAGIKTLKFADTPLSGEIQLIPLIESVYLVGDTLAVTGKGWNSNAQGIVLEVSGQKIDASSIQEKIIFINRPITINYGYIPIRLIVGGQYSTTYNWLYEAAQVQGKVFLPASGNSTNLAIQNHIMPQAFKGKIINVYGSKQSVLSLLKQHWLDNDIHYEPLFGLTRIGFSSPLEAEKAWEILKNSESVHHLEWDDGVFAQDDGQVILQNSSSLGTQWFWRFEGVGSDQKSKGENITVAVVDTGCIAHPDFKDRLLPGYDFVDGDNDPIDIAGHGTHVTGLIAANGLEVYGAAPQSKVLPIRVLPNSGNGSIVNVAKGILWAANALPEIPNPNPAQIINLSLGTSGYSEALSTAIAEVQKRNILVVAATGNDGGSLSYPAALPGVLAVTSVAGPQIQYQPSYANRGAGTAIAAFGGDLTIDQDGNGVKDGILSTDVNSEGTPTYGLRHGTSMAAPQVSGIAASLLSSGIQPTRLYQTLMNTALDLGVKGKDEQFGHGLVQSYGQNTPRVYVLVKNESGDIVAWTLVDKNYFFLLKQLPNDKNLEFIAATDQNNNGVLAEAGEMLSSSVWQAISLGKTIVLPDLKLQLTSGEKVIHLP